ncbi:hypothetical protein Q3G72_004194 [Acer saccharum]|nr:hypothetical protein Q3G72_004194 [Acer saccharum]
MLLVFNALIEFVGEVISETANCIHLTPGNSQQIPQEQETLKIAKCTPSKTAKASATSLKAVMGVKFRIIAVDTSGTARHMHMQNSGMKMKLHVTMHAREASCARHGVLLVLVYLSPVTETQQFRRRCGSSSL